MIGESMPQIDRPRSTVKSRLLVAALLALSAVASGCSGRFWVAGSTWFERTYKPQVGRWTYDDVVRYEQSDDHLPPTVVTSYSLSRDLILLTRTWGEFDGKTVQKTVYHAGSFLYPATSETESVLVRNGRRNSFVFDRRTRLLLWSQYLHYQEGREVDRGEVGDASFKPGPEEEFSTDPEAKAAKTPRGSLEVRLRDLQELRDKKVITEEEYGRMRAKALDDFR